MARRPIVMEAYAVYILNAGLSAFCFMMVATAGVVYQVDYVGLSPLQLVLVGTVLEATVFLCEVPTGVVADVYSRRMSVIIGTFLIGAGFALEGALPLFGTILAAQVLWGVGYTFTSGATQAWIADEVGEARAGPAFVRGAQAGQAGALLGILASVLLGSGRIYLPIVIGGGLFGVLGIFLILAMPERNFRPAPREGRSAFGQMVGTARAGVGLVRARPMLFTILGVSLFYGLYSEGFDRLSTALLLRDIGLPAVGALQPVAWIGLIEAGALVLGAMVTEVARRRVDTSSRAAPIWTSLVSSSIIAGALIALGLTQSFTAALALCWTLMPLRELLEPFHLAWLNHQLESSVRATAISLDSQMHALGEILGGPLAGTIATLHSVRAAIVSSGLVLAPAVLLTALALRAERRAPEARRAGPAAQPADPG